MKYIVDLDNTLVYTDNLNSESYNYALKAMGYHPIRTKNRITRETILKKYSSVSKEIMLQLINLKQQYFIENVDKLVINEDMFKFLKEQGFENCALWTSANKDRANAILKNLNILDFFVVVRFTNKLNIREEISYFEKIFNCSKSDLCFIEDNQKLINRLRKMKLQTINIKNEI